MNCLIVAATPHEIAPLTDQLQKRESSPFGNNTVDTLVTGIGLMATTYALQKQIQMKRPDLIIQAGIAGSFLQSIPLGEVVLISSDRVADLMVEEEGELKTMSDLGLMSDDQPPYKNGWLINPATELIKSTGLSEVKGISINQITTSSRKIEQFKHKYDPVTESMEGAALHYVALMEGIDFLQIRAISNYIGERNKKNWRMKESIENLNNHVLKLLHRL